MTRRGPAASSGGSGGDTTPPDAPAIISPTYDHSFMLQAVMDNQRAIGTLIAKVDRLIDDVSDLGEDMGDLKHQASFLKGWLAGAVLMIGIIVAIGAFVIDKSWDSIADKLNQIPTQQQIAPAPTAPALNNSAPPG